MSKLNLSKIDPTATGSFKSKRDASASTRALKKKMYDLLYLMFAHDKHSLLIILQGIDTSGKDGVVRHIFASANPQGIRVYSFKKPSIEELRRDFIWRCHRHAPQCGLAAIFNRSYYEEVTTAMVHPEVLKLEHIPDKSMGDIKFFKHRYQRINDFEKLLTQRGTVVLKMFLHISKDEQKKRLKDRLEDPRRNWKFSEEDVVEREYWDKHMAAFDKMIKHTSTKHAPWHVIPSDNKWFRDYLVSKITVEALSKLKMSFPKSKRKVSSIK